MTSLAAAAVYRAAGITAVTPSASAASVTDGSEWFFSSIFGDHTQGDFLAAHASPVLGADEVAVVYDDNESGRSAQAAFTASFARFGTVAAALPVTDDPGAAVDRVTALTSGTPILAGGSGAKDRTAIG